MNQIPIEAIHKLESLAIEEVRIRKEIEELWIRYIHPLLTKCSSIEEGREVLKQIILKDKEGNLLDMPGLCSIYIAYQWDRIRLLELNLEHEDN